ncbi:hypothetical protein [Nostoc sp. TCL240-02]|uniref:hypothetical protein n=1 Tax=Nostoc sp. TCL240-02 TaxID=2572090 RepID=UPI00157F9300|nr:hypothetical protein [Nostoc sp. TCL240-02]
MKLIKKVLAICFLLFGIPFSAVMILEIMNPKTPAQEKENGSISLFKVAQTDNNPLR